MFTKTDTQTHPHTQRHAHRSFFHSFSQDVIMAPAWMLLIERIKNMDVIMAPSWMLLIERIKNTDVIMAPAWILLIERIKNTDVIMARAWMLSIERIKNTDVIMAPAWMLLIERIPAPPPPPLPPSSPLHPPCFSRQNPATFFFTDSKLCTRLFGLCVLASCWASVPWLTCFTSALAVVSKRASNCAARRVRRARGQCTARARDAFWAVIFTIAVKVFRG